MIFTIWGMSLPPGNLARVANALHRLPPTICGILRAFQSEPADHTPMFKQILEKDSRIAVLGLGYVGLPLAVEFGKHFQTIGFDISADRVNALRKCEDSTLEVSTEELKLSTKLTFTVDIEALRQCSIYIVTVPTPIDDNRRPDLGPLIAASKTVGQVISAGDIVIYESTVYPGATEHDCVPVVEQHSGLTFNKDFFAGYSPERINPGDKQHRLPDIVKVTSGSTPEAAAFVDALYSTIITAGTHPAPSLQVAEAAKVIENTQRDLNIALINELSLIFERLDLDTQAVLAAAGTKWNFLPFQPGLVGGHCIGVDPYYLTYKAEESGYHPEIILAGRKINDGMGRKIVHRFIKLMLNRAINPAGARILILGFAFKENCPDLRNTRVIDVVEELRSYGIEPEICDPWVDSDEAQTEYGVSVTREPSRTDYDGVLLCVAHDQFRSLGLAGLCELTQDPRVIFDVKGILPAHEDVARL
jgi:UDP-N-acetyl-D-galactosamine dehydrogenase